MKIRIKVEALPWSYEYDVDFVWWTVFKADFFSY